MHYGNIKNCDIANGIGVRVTLFVSGCTNRCPHCFQPETWDFCYGQPFTAATEAKLLKMLEPSYIDGLTLLGGEPFEPENQRALLPFVTVPSWMPFNRSNNSLAPSFMLRILRIISRSSSCFLCSRTDFR